jgi:hypothetical protein
MGLRAELKKAACFKCGAIGTLQEIIYGLPSEDFDFSKNISGGCVMSDESPSIGCSKCDWRGIRNSYTGEIIDVEEGRME